MKFTIILHNIPKKYRRGFGLVVSVVVPSMLAVLPYARGRGFDSRFRLLEERYMHKTKNKFFLVSCVPALYAKMPWVIFACADCSKS
jgi:hypothetical protein